MSSHVHYFKVTFPSSNAMQDAAEAIRIFAEHHPMLLIGDPPLVLWTDADIFVGTVVYTTTPGVGLLPDPQSVQVKPIDVGEIPFDAHFVLGDDRHRRDTGEALL